MPSWDSGPLSRTVVPWQRTILLGALAAVAYFVTARVGYAFSIPGGVVTLWPPSGVTLGLLLTCKKREWPYVIAGSFLGSLLSDLRSGYSLGLGMAAGAAHVGESFVAAQYLTWRSDTPVTLTNLRTIVALTTGTAIVSNAVTAVFGAAVLHYGLHVPFGGAWLAWWIGDGLGMLIVTPVFLAWSAAAATGEMLGASNERYRTVVDTATDAIITIDQDSRIQFANPATERTFGYTLQELAGRDLTMLMPHDFRERHKTAMRRYLSTGQKHIAWQGVALTGLHKSGKEIPLEVSFGEMAEEGRRLFTGILRDISDKRAAEEALDAMEEQARQSHKMEAIGQLAGGIAHDFNNLLTVINGHCELLAETLDAASPQQADLTEIRRAGERATSLTQQLLAFSRRQILAPRVLDLSDSLNAIEPMLKRLIGEQVQVIVQTAGTLGRVKADPGQIEQVILNLAINARDAMPDGGTLRLELNDVVLDESSTRQHVDAIPGPFVRLTVSDTGVGMDAGTLERIFEPFFTTKAKGRGTGLGLSMVHGIVKQSGGLLWAYSEPGHGSRFEVYLPRVEAAADAKTSEEAGLARGGSETILVVEDEEGVRRLAERILGQRGYRVLAAATPRLAVEVAARHEGRIDLLLSDVVLPEISGKLLAEQLIAARPSLRVLYMSGYTDNAIVHHGVLEPDTPFVQKPFPPATLLRKVRELLDA